MAQASRWAAAAPFATLLVVAEQILAGWIVGLIVGMTSVDPGRPGHRRNSQKGVPALRLKADGFRERLRTLSQPSGLP